jgi:hypothetical protein
VERNGGPKDRFQLTRDFDRPTRSYGFYAEAPLPGGPMPVMGNVQEMFYDQTRNPVQGAAEAKWTSKQLQEYVLKYFMRTSSFRPPETYVDAAQPIPPPALSALSWCPKSLGSSLGFGFTQLFKKPVGGGPAQAFPSYERDAIVDQRDVGKLYEWLVLKVRIFDFTFGVHPFGDTGPELVFSLDEQSYLVVHEEFINNKENHLPGVLGEYGIGYSFIKNPPGGPFAYGPGEFDAALELINFRIYETGYISVRMIFIANRPTAVTNIALSPVNFSFRLADAFSFGLASRLFGPVKNSLEQLAPKISVDPVLAYVQAANAISGGYAARTLCISTDRLQKLFLIQHFQQHYETILSSLSTWRRFPDWLDASSLPPWVISGIGS